MKIEKNISLSGFTSWKVGGAAEFYFAPQNQEELIEACLWAQGQSLPITFLGGGTNVLISDQGIEGLVVHLKKMQELSVQEVGGRLEIVAECGVAKSKLLKVFLKYKLAPALFLAGLPGDIGGGLAMNAGVAEVMSPREFVDFTDWIEVFDFNRNKVVKYQKEDLDWGYRFCGGWQPGVILRAGLSWSLKEEVDLLKKVKELNQRRLAKQPLELPSCGSVFRNPENDKAGRLIDECGLKGLAIGGAQVSLKHANFIVNTGNAKASEIKALIERVQSEVFQKKEIHLQTEVVFLPGRFT